MDNIIHSIALNAIPFLLAITLHEAAHGYAARIFGDRTAEMLGRISANPIRHIDWVGTVALPLILTITKSPLLFGWAKPVPVNLNNLHNPKRDMIWVAAAGPLANLLMGIAWALALRFSGPETAIGQIAGRGIYWNLMLMTFNLLPILPLDGGRIVAGLLPGPLSYKFSRLEPYGFFIVLGLMVLMPEALFFVLGPMQDAALAIFKAIVGVRVSNV
ncbi:MAG: site-2 protease family protein [Casimicrobium sp.]